MVDHPIFYYALCYGLSNTDHIGYQEWTSDFLQEYLLTWISKPIKPNGPFARLACRAGLPKSSLFVG